MAPSQQSYCGSELELFEHAVRWKQYWSATIQPYLGPSVLEVGAGMGANLPHLWHGEPRGWTLLEPDPLLADSIRSRLAKMKGAENHRVVVGATGDLDEGARFDTILYIDVLEHIADDQAELEAASNHLSEGAALVILAPAHPNLYSEFDRAVGHHRRYQKASLTAAVPPDLTLVKLIYMDSAGLLASLGNRLLLRKSMPSLAQIRLWDRVLVPLSRGLDRLTAYRFGKTVLGIWRREAGHKKVTSLS